MAFTPTASLKGSNQVFSVSQHVKDTHYVIMALQRQNLGNFQLIRSFR